MKTLISDLKKKVDLTRLYARILTFCKRYFVKEPDSKKNVLKDVMYQLYAGQNVTIKTVWELKGWVGIYTVIKND